MKTWKKLLLGLLAATLALLGGLAGLIFWMSSPTDGPRIGTYASPRTALLVVDIQEDYTGPAASKPYRDAQRIVAVSNALLSRAQEKGLVVAYVANVIDNPVVSVLAGGMNAPGTPGIAIDRRILRVPGGRHFEKHRSDSFSNPELDAYLREQQVDRVLIVGLDGAFCINSTARAALARGYRVTLFLDGIATESSKSLEQLAAGWRAAGAEVTTSAQAL